MDLPTCPACGQSVLEDNAVNCPFCGASMSGKPQAGKPAPAGKGAASATAAPPEPAKEKPASKQPAQKQAEEDPFAVNSAEQKKQAVALRPEPTKGRAHEVVCPMCETTGYTSTKAAGREVRCCNPDCLVPVFTAPELPPEEPKEEPVKQGPSKIVLGVAAVAVVVLAGVGIWFFGFSGSGTGGAEPTEDDMVYVPDSSSGGDSAADSTADAGTDDEGGPGAIGSRDPETPREILADSLESMQKASLRRDNNRNKPYCVKLTAIALVQTGSIDEAKKQTAQMENLRPSIPYYRISPLVEIAWNARKAGDSAAAKSALDEAVKASAELPARGSTRFPFAIELAAALVGAGRQAEAQALIAKHEEATEDAQSSAELAVMQATGQYNADAYAAEDPIHRWAAPLTTAVVAVLVARGESAAARQWAAAQQDAEVLTGTTVVWADSLLRAKLLGGGTIDESAIDTAAGALSAGARARLHARLASRYLQAGQAAEAESLLAQAWTEIRQTAPPPEVVLPDMKTLVTYELPDTAPLRIQALAAAQLMVAESLAGNAEKSTAALQLAMQFLRGSAPSVTATRRLLNQIKDQGPRAMRDLLKKALDLTSDDKARLSFNDYRRNCDQFNAAAVRRFLLQEKVLAAAVEAGLLEPAWQEVRSRSEQADADHREPWGESRVPWLIVEKYEQAGNPAAAEPVRSLLNAAAARRPVLDRIVKAAEEQIAAGKFEAAAREFEGRTAEQAPQSGRDTWRLRLAGRLVAEKKLDAAFEFLRAIAPSDATFRESALWFVAAQGTQAGQFKQVWEIGQMETWSATEVVSIYGGLIETLEVPAGMKDEG